MLLRTTLALWVFLFTFPGSDGLVQAKASKKDPNGCIPFNRFSGGRSPKPQLFLSAFAISLRQKASADTPAPKGLRVACHSKPKM